MHLLADILGKKNTQRLNGNSVSHLLVTALLGCSALTTGSVIFNQHVAAIAQEQSVSFSISAQPLSPAIREFIATTGWQISYSSDAVAGKRSSCVSGNMSPEAALRKLISGAGLQLRKRSSTSVALLPFGSKADASVDSELLDEVVVYANTNPSNTESLFGDGDPRAIGKTTISRSLIETGGDAGGDINSQLKTLPNVQWQDHTSSEAGDNTVSEQDLRPGQYSISGAERDSNLFMLDGVGISTSGAGYGDTRHLSTPIDERTSPNPHAIYGLHPQTLYVPDSIIKSLTVHDSNISARYGGFQGGVIEAETIDTTSDRWSGWLSIEGTSNDLAKFNLITKSGENPLGIEPYSFLKLNGSVGVSGPLAEGISFLSSLSNRYASTSRARDPRFVEQKNIETYTNSITALNKLKLERDWGVLELSNTMTFYDQMFESHLYKMDEPGEVTGDASSTKLDYNRALEDWAGFSNINLRTEAFFNTSEQGNEHKQNDTWIVFAKRSGGEFLEIPQTEDCQDLPSLRFFFCNQGGLGQVIQSEKKIGAKFQLDADWKKHTISLGGGFNRIFATQERKEDYHAYSATKGGTFECDDPNDLLCVDNKLYLNSHSTQPAYKTNVSLTELNLWAEIELDLGKVDLIPGVRLDYDSYLENINIAPRLSASWEVHDRITFTAGFSRYYDNAMLGYALTAGRPGALKRNRVISDDGKIYNEVRDPDIDGYWEISSNPSTDYAAAGLKTPYNDEFTIGTIVNDPIIDGTLRLKYVHRACRDKFTRSKDTARGDYELSNDGESKYDAVTVEYAKSWNDLTFGPLNSVGFKVNATWSESHRNDAPLPDENDATYFEQDSSSYFYYHGKVYTKDDFNVVTGNSDIPITAGARLQAGLFEDRLNLWASASFTMPYKGVIKDPEKYSTKNLPYKGDTVTARNYVDYKYDFATYVNVGGSYQLAKSKYGETVLTAKVDNIFNEVGHATAEDDKPFKKGRQFWLGLKTSF
ncbi:secretin and TonB N-terminal domain-containing protein [Pseudovibrio ascidiaceicola]|uniref:TonB-dependent receptor n=1 Tax=Pseudovibrio ascidiaceicola TaxID=285279 RepID=UPI003D36BFEF